MSRTGQAARMDAVVAAHSYTAFRQRDDGLAVQIAQINAASLQGALAELTHSLAHKDSLFVVERQMGLRFAVVHFYRVRKGAAVFQPNPETGRSERIEPLKLDRQCSLPVDAFTPTRPFDAFADNAVGLDATLVEVQP